MLHKDAFEHVQISSSNQIASISTIIYYLVMTTPQNACNKLCTRNSHELVVFVAR